MTGRKNFGFGIHGGRQIDLDLADTSLARELSGIVPAWNTCINCGSCTATCPAGINFRKLHYGIRMPLELPAFKKLATLKQCLLCGKCQLVCPRGIPTRYLSIQIMQKIGENAEVVPSV